MAFGMKTIEQRKYRNLNEGFCLCALHLSAWNIVSHKGRESVACDMAGENVIVIGTSCHEEVRSERLS